MPAASLVLPPARPVRWTLLGPAFIAAIGYIDPGNFATNIQAGSAFGYQLLWVVLWANLMAMLIQWLSAKLGIITGRNLAEHLQARLPRPAVWAYWIQAEIVAMATDLAEVIGAAVGFQLLLGVSLLQGALLTAVLSSGLLCLQQRGQKSLEGIIGLMLLLVALAYVVELLWSKPHWPSMTTGLLLPGLPNREALYLAAGVLGATVMPHVIYLHSALTQQASSGCGLAERLRHTKIDVGVAMGIAGLVNLAIMAMAAAVFHEQGHTDVVELEQAYQILTPLLGQAAATLFGLSLVVSGVSSTVVGTLAGQVVMQSFVRFSIPLWLRRGLTLAPSLILIAMGCNTTEALVFSQVVLSFGIGLALIPLLSLTSNAQLMGAYRNRGLTRWLGRLILMLVLALNLFLLLTLL